MKTWFIAALALSVGLTFGPTGAHGKTWHVNAAGTGDAPSIAAALDSCAAGDSVLVAAGSYQIATHLFIRKDRVSLVSEAGAAATILQRAAAHVYLMVSSHSVVEGFTLNSIYVGNNGSFTQGGRISNNVFRGSGDPDENAMLFWEHFGMTISENCIYSYTGSGVVLTESSEFVFDHNTITACGAGIVLDGSYPGDEVRNNLIVGNSYGINLSAGAASRGVSCNDVFGNSIANYIDGTDPTGTDGNISVDPQFCATDPAGTGNFLLQSDSPCVPGNHPDGASCGIIGAYTVGCQEISVKQATWGAIKTMYH